MRRDCKSNPFLNGCVLFAGLCIAPLSIERDFKMNREV